MHWRMPSRSTQKALAAVVALATILVGLEASYTLYRCRVDQVVRLACCCPELSSEGEHHYAARSTFKGAGCCDIESYSAPAASPVSEPRFKPAVAQLAGLALPVAFASLRQLCILII